jgi:hypothetical protein
MADQGACFGQLYQIPMPRFARRYRITESPLLARFYRIAQSTLSSQGTLGG